MFFLQKAFDDEGVLSGGGGGDPGASVSATELIAKADTGANRFMCEQHIFLDRFYSGGHKNIIGWDCRRD